MTITLGQDLRWIMLVLAVHRSLPGVPPGPERALGAAAVPTHSDDPIPGGGGVPIRGLRDDVPCDDGLADDLPLTGTNILVKGPDTPPQVWKPCREEIHPLLVLVQGIRRGKLESNHR